MSHATLYDTIDLVIEGFVAPAGRGRDDAIADAAERFGVSAPMLADMASLTPAKRAGSAAVSRTAGSPAAGRTAPA